MPIEPALREGKSLFWTNPNYRARGRDLVPDYRPQIQEAQERLDRFRPLIQALFPSTQAWGGRIESDLQALDHYQASLANFQGAGQIYLKKDHQLALAGSVKGRGGVYEVLKIAEGLALAQGFDPSHSYEELASPAYRRLFGRYSIQVGSTGNLGLAIGRMSRALGFQARVHMSQEAKEWKKDLLRQEGAQVQEYEGDYGLALARGRQEALASPRTFFIDDEHSQDLFFGYALAGAFVRDQLAQAGRPVDADHPLLVYLPCGVGGAPGGILYGLKMALDHVYGFFMEPAQAPAMILGLATGRQDQISVQDLGLSGQTLADGLAVSRPSSFIGRLVEPLLSGGFTVEEEAFLAHSRALWQAEGIYIEPSAAAACQGVASWGSPAWQVFLDQAGLADSIHRATHLLWATGGSLVPEAVRQEEVGQ